MLLVGGRSLLITLVLGSLGIYYMSLFMMPVQVKKRFEALWSNFFWEYDNTKKKLHWVNWNLTMASKEKGGLRLRSLEPLNHTLIQKWR